MGKKLPMPYVPSGGGSNLDHPVLGWRGIAAFNERSTNLVVYLGKHYDAARGMFQQSYSYFFTV
ncbi:hypothetical protein [Nostoc sp.]|uniref:hypothetical protein n=1 Tax=Nostoc sp. TaxID=1180 RepID=UPI002FF6AD7A